MELKSKYDLGEFVYAISCFRKRKTITCPLCKGLGKVTIADTDRTTYCPDCVGNRTVTKIEDQHWSLDNIVGGIIGRIEVTVYEKPEFGENKVQYMLDSSGIGSGTVWDEDRLFRTKEEALEVCKQYDRRDGYETVAN